MSKKKKSFLGTATYQSASDLENTQWTKFSAARAHGYAAEDWNALVDRLCGKKVDKVGLSNELNGADRIVNGVKIQSKYCESAYESVYSAFKDGRYRYTDMKLEVPKGQGPEATRLFAERIRRGEVPGVTDPAMAKDIIVEGHCTYRQAQRLLKAGNLTSLKYDVMSHGVTCLCLTGLTFVVTYAGARTDGKSPKEAFNMAWKHALATGATSMTVSVALSQFFRTGIGRKTLEWVGGGAQKVVTSASKSDTGMKVLRQVATPRAGKQASEFVVRSTTKNALRSNIITATAITVAVTLPDVIRSLRGRQSWKKTACSAVINTAGTAGGWCGAAIGSSIGTAICPGPGTIIGGIIGGMGLSMGAQASVKKVVDWTIA